MRVDEAEYQDEKTPPKYSNHENNSIYSLDKEPQSLLILITIFFLGVWIIGIFSFSIQDIIVSDTLSLRFVILLFLTLICGWMIRTVYYTNKIYFTLYQDSIDYFVNGKDLSFDLSNIRELTYHRYLRETQTRTTEIPEYYRIMGRYQQGRVDLSIFSDESIITMNNYLDEILQERFKITSKISSTKTKSEWELEDSEKERFIIIDDDIDVEFN